MKREMLLIGLLLLLSSIAVVAWSIVLKPIIPFGMRQTLLLTANSILVGCNLAFLISKNWSGMIASTCLTMQLLFLVDKVWTDIVV